jgi:hypothetical protein
MNIAKWAAAATVATAVANATVIESALQRISTFIALQQLVAPASC